MKGIKILGILSLILGGIASIIWILFPLPYGLILALPTGFLGLVASTMYVFMDTKYQINTKKITPGIIGMVLSSIPILVVLIIMVMDRFK